ncbi:MAG: hypothetical protein QW735_01495 [archaeon]
MKGFVYSSIGAALGVIFLFLALQIFIVEQKIDESEQNAIKILSVAYRVKDLKNAFYSATSNAVNCTTGKEYARSIFSNSLVNSSGMNVTYTLSDNCPSSITVTFTVCTEDGVVCKTSAVSSSFSS